jgi:hypothetical protein
MTKTSSYLLFAFLVGCAPVGDHDEEEGTDPEVIVHPPGADEANERETFDQAATGQASTAPIQFHSTGTILPGTTTIFYIWYGTWSTIARNQLTAFAQTIGGTPYFNINTTYTDTAGTRAVSNSVQYVMSIDDSYSYGTNLTDSNVRSIVLNAINSGKLPFDTHGIYFVLGDSTTKEVSGFCTNYCGWHSYTAYQGKNIKYSFVGNPIQCPSACQPQALGPNGYGHIDAMTSIIAHELEEAVTDPLLGTWYDATGYENADKCAWTFGTTYTTANGAKANMNIAGKDYLIQQNWVNIPNGGYCALKYP